MCKIPGMVVISEIGNFKSLFIAFYPQCDQVFANPVIDILVTASHRGIRNKL